MRLYYLNRPACWHFRFAELEAHLEGKCAQGIRGESINAVLVIGRRRSMGSGVVIAAGGYIMTNAHVVANARRVEVVLPGPRESGGVAQLASHGRRIDAAIVGVAKEIDLALLKIDAALSPPPLPLADYDTVRQGQLVFAFGSPEGLRNSVTMGVVSAVARQPDVENPLVYVQTDAPINHGNSGGPLVDVEGRVVGINTFIVSDSGGSQGLGFAIPSALVGMAYPKLRRYGHLHRGEIGILLQTITPTLAGGLQLPQDWGAMISDVQPGSPAAAAGLQIADVVSQLAPLGLRRLRITGGEPTIRPNLDELIRMLRAIPAVEDIALSTNGVRLPQIAELYRDAGLDRVNISADSLRPDRIAAIARRNLGFDPIAAATAAHAAGLSPIKINVVVMRG